MAMVKCKECGSQVSSKAKSCPNCGAKPPKKTSIVTWFVLVLIVFVAYGMVNTASNLTPEEKAKLAVEAQEKEKEKEKEKLIAAAKKAEEDKDNKRKGFHCLSGWDGSHAAVKDAVEKQMRDPDSFEHIETRITPVDKNGKHSLVMKYRAANGFGGMSVGQAEAIIDNDSCQATISLIE